MKDYYCPKCGSVDVFIDDRGTQKALMCGDCGAWIKWVGKKEMPLVQRYIASLNRGDKEIDSFKKSLNESIQKLGVSKEKMLKIINEIYKEA